MTKIIYNIHSKLNKFKYINAIEMLCKTQQHLLLLFILAAEVKREIKREMWNVDILYLLCHDVMWMFLLLYVYLGISGIIQVLLSI